MFISIVTLKRSDMGVWCVHASDASLFAKFWFRTKKTSLYVHCTHKLSIELKCTSRRTTSHKWMCHRHVHVPIHCKWIELLATLHLCCKERASVCVSTFETFKIWTGKNQQNKIKSQKTKPNQTKPILSIRSMARKLASFDDATTITITIAVTISLWCL